MTHAPEDQQITAEDLALAARLRETLCATTADALPVTYRALAKSLGLAPPHTIHRLTTALELTMREDVANGVPMIAALAISRWRGGLPAPGFFALAAALGRHAGAEAGPAAASFHRRECEAAIAHWAATP